MPTQFNRPVFRLPAVRLCATEAWAFAGEWRALDTIEEANGVILLDWSILRTAIAGCAAHSLVDEPA